MTALTFLAVLTALPPAQDLEPPATALTGPSSARLALPVAIRFDPAIVQEVTPLVKKDTGKAETSSRDPITTLNRFAPGVARRHFEQASWGDEKAPRSLVIRSVSVGYSDGPHYEVKVVVDRYDGERRAGQASGSGYGFPDRTGERIGAGFAGPFAPIVNNNANQPKPVEDAAVLRAATLAALDSALMQLSAVWSAEQMMVRARLDAEEAQRKAQQGPVRSKKKR